jgi:hypothetical protein
LECFRKVVEWSYLSVEGRESAGPEAALVRRLERELVMATAAN